jgi:23S rRNA (adenine2503-C2)-methyltransferase
MGCTFCATGLGGFDRNLSPEEIVGQYLMLQNAHNVNLGRASGPIKPGLERISRIVFMGMGEPLLNLDAVLKSLTIFHDEIGLSYRHITISTVGLVPQILELAKLNLPFHLALSLHSPLDHIRDSLMPVNKRWPVAEVIGAMKTYQKATRRKITIEYLLIGDLTDSREQAAELARLIKGTPSVVNVIPFNYVDTKQGFARPTRERTRRFKTDLKNLGVNVTERVERGHDIAAACGQLAGEHTGRFSRRLEASGLPAHSS